MTRSILSSEKEVTRVGGDGLNEVIITQYPGDRVRQIRIWVRPPEGISDRDDEMYRSLCMTKEEARTIAQGLMVLVEMVE